ncbi:hypothetical protein B0T22DRAFT_448613 [Podospora appendiculata]|uniref:Transcription factor Iwr1 domain-containing protein n=1 Tax=Podospora appendiculata TaxID=314037 RepID=A0AAE1CFT4_9PEZI|nr:hypothetical protein B0T22DRAFT_448613 [Podospora appendiculata]
MSLPPDTIQVKRKRGRDEGPVDFLRVESNKRHRSVSGDGTWVYQRKQADAKPLDDSHGSTTTPVIPTIQATKEGDENRPVKSMRRQAPSKFAAADSLAVPAPASLLDDLTNDKTRRFHLSRSNTPQPATKVSKKRASPALFVERSTKRSRESSPLLLPQRPKTIPSRLPTPARTTGTEEDWPSPNPPREPGASARNTTGSIRYKRPGSRTRISTSAAPAKHALPPSLLNREREGLDMDQLARDMDSYTLSQITINLDKMDEDSAKAAAAAVSSPARKSKFKPKAPATRYVDRHPEYRAELEHKKATAAAHPAEAMDIDGETDTDEDEYVLETYERIPASRLKDQVIPPDRVGLLVFESEPDKIDFFFGEEGDSDDDFPEDDEDECAENYYTADYPDEDLDWDDEFDREPYKFVNGNASDEEEYDENEFINGVWDKSGLPPNPFLHMGETE